MDANSSSPPAAQTTRSEPAARSGTVMAVLAIAVGLIAGIGAIFFRALISLFHDLLFLGKFSLVYDANDHTPPFWIEGYGWLVIFVPVLGAIGVAWLVQKFA